MRNPLHLKMRRIPSAQKRPASVIIGVLVCLSISSFLLIGAVTLTLRQRRQIRRELQMEQTRWLAEAGLVRAISQLDQTAEYNGEAIELKLDPSSSCNELVEIVLSEIDGDHRDVSVVASIRRNGVHDAATVRSRKIRINYPRPQEK